MKGKKYSLADYIVSITPDDSTMFKTISIGGQGSYMGSVRVANSTDLWTTRGYATGAFTHTKNLDRTGTCSISLNQLSDEVVSFINFCNVYYGNSTSDAGCTISIIDRNGDKVANCESCYITRIPEQSFSDSPNDQEWSFGCGVVAFRD